MAVLTLAVSLLGVRDWAVPRRVLGGWQVADVPPSLTALVVGTAVACLVAAVVVVHHDTGLPMLSPAFLGWFAICLVAAAALVWNALVLAADAAVVVGAIIPVLHWLFTAVPAALGALVARGHGADVSLRAGLGTGVVTVPLFALGWALFNSREPTATAVLGSLWSTLLLGVAPLVVAALVCSRPRWPAEARTA